MGFLDARRREAVSAELAKRQNKRLRADDAVIHGIDIDPRCASIDDPDLSIHIGSQDDKDVLSRVVSEIGGKRRKAISST